MLASTPKPSPPPNMPPPVPALPDELLEEVFLRLPPAEPECLVCASLASKLWHGTLSGPRFRGLYREFHGSPPMLGFVYAPVCTPAAYSFPKWDDKANVLHFKPTTKFRARIPGGDGDSGGLEYDVWDCRHGRVLLGTLCPTKLLVWNPMTGCRRALDGPEAPAYPAYPAYRGLGAAVLCTVTGCDHRACHEGPFRVILVSLDESDAGCVAYAHISLPQMGDGSKPSSGLSPANDWTKPCADLHLGDVSAFISKKPPVFIEDALYFLIEHDDGSDVVIAILKCDLAANCLSLIDAPPLETDIAIDTEAILVMAMADGSLGFAKLDMLTLHLWSRQMGFDGVLSWTQHRGINLKELLPIQNPMKRLTLVGSVEGSDTIFVTTDLGIYEISLKSLRCKKLWKGEMFDYLIPYMSFYDPLEKGEPL